ncbi:hypothetical protein SAMN04488118_11956 [Epibacterium ulvae]|uniref:Uncharacterized protein n=1 Tax=Epibacterium ulvae TaxID=1156985 RepID=A0A1G5RIG2_9RHOB|nr:hypothetical protein SAMN04488118_11956 [Epibacterium ulvae]
MCGESLKSPAQPTLRADWPQDRFTDKAVVYTPAFNVGYLLEIVTVPLQKCVEQLLLGADAEFRIGILSMGFDCWHGDA